jgi:hypothetical protein
MVKIVLGMFTKYLLNFVLSPFKLRENTDDVSLFNLKGIAKGR